MDWSTQAKTAQERAISAFTARPGQALSTQHGVAILEDGLRCRYEQDGHFIHIDMPAAVGGTGQAPTPGFYGRAAICSCLAIGIRMAALREDLLITSVEVSVDQDWDNRGLFGMDGAKAGPLDTRIAIVVVSPDAKDKIEDLIARAMSIDPWLVALAEKQSVTVTSTVSGRAR